MKTSSLFDAAGLPCTSILDHNGVFRYGIIGGVTGENLKKLILSILKFITKQPCNFSINSSLLDVF